MNCYICGKDKFSKREGKVRDNDKLEVLQCDWCGLVFLSNYPNFEHIDDNFYEQSKMRVEDKEKNIEEMLESARVDDDRRYEYLKDKIRGKFILDYGCGAGGFMMNVSKNDYRGSSLSLIGIEPEKQTREYLQNKGHNVFEDIQTLREGCLKIGLHYDYITMFHTLEHLRDSKQTLRELKDLLNLGGKIIIEVPNADDALLTMYDCKAFQNFTYWSCHLFLFNLNSFVYIARDLGMKLKYKFIQRYHLSNHMWWLMNGEPRGHKQMTFLNDEKLMKEYERALKEMEATDTLWVELENV